MEKTYGELMSVLLRAKSDARLKRSSGLLAGIGADAG